MKRKKIYICIMMLCGFLLSLSIALSSDVSANAEPYDYFNDGGIVRVEAGDDYIVALTDTGKVFSFGSNDGRALGIGVGETFPDEYLTWYQYPNNVANYDFNYDYEMHRKHTDELYREINDITANFIGMIDGEKIVEIVSNGYYNAALSNHGRLYYFGGTAARPRSQFFLPYDITSYFNLGDTEVIVQPVVNDLEVLVLTSFGRVLVLLCENFEFSLTELTDRFDNMDTDQNEEITFVTNNWAGTNLGKAYFWETESDYTIGNVTENLNLVAGERIVQAIRIPEGFALLTNHGRAINSSGESLSNLFGYLPIKKIAYSKIRNFSFQDQSLKLKEEYHAITVLPTNHQTDIATGKDFYVFVQDGHLFASGDYDGSKSKYFYPTDFHIGNDVVAIFNTGTNENNDTMIIVTKNALQIFGQRRWLHNFGIFGNIIQAEIISQDCLIHEWFLEDCEHYLYSELLLFTDQNEFIVIEDINGELHLNDYSYIASTYLDRGDPIEFITKFQNVFCFVTSSRDVVFLDSMSSKINRNHYGDNTTFSQVVAGDKLIKTIEFDFCKDSSPFKNMSIYISEYGRIYATEKYTHNFLQDITQALNIYEPIIEVEAIYEFIYLLSKSGVVYKVSAYDVHFNLYDSSREIDRYILLHDSSDSDNKIIQIVKRDNVLIVLTQKGEILLAGDIEIDGYFVAVDGKTHYPEVMRYFPAFWHEQPGLKITKIYVGRYQTFFITNEDIGLAMGLNNNYQLFPDYNFEIRIGNYYQMQSQGSSWRHLMYGNTNGYYLEYAGTDELTYYVSVLNQHQIHFSLNPFDHYQDFISADIFDNLYLHVPSFHVSHGSYNLVYDRLYTKILPVSPTKGLLKIIFYNSECRSFSNEISIQINIVHADLEMKLLEQPAEEVFYGDEIPLNVYGGYFGGLEYEFSNPEILIVQDCGRVLTAVGVGETTVTIRAGTSYLVNEYNEIIFTVRVLKASQTIKEKLSFIQKTYGSTPFRPVIFGALGTGAWHCESSDSSVAYMGEDGMIQTQNTGTAELTITKLGDTNYENSNSIKIVLNVIKADQIIQPEDSSWFITRTYGDPDFAPLIHGALSSGAWLCESIDESVAYLDESGFIRLFNAGTTELLITKSGDSNYNDSNVIRISISISQASQTLVRGTALFTKTQGDPSFSLNISGGLGTGQYQFTFSPNNNNLVDIDQNLMATIIGGGNVTVLVSKQGDRNYKSSNSVSVLVRATGTQAITHDGQPVIYKNYGDSNFQVRAIGGKTATMQCESKNLSVVTIDPQGNVTIVGVGTAIVTLRYLSSTTYLQSNTLEFTIIIEKGSQSFILNESSIISKSLGDSAFALNIINGAGTGLLSFTSTNPNVVTVDASGLISIVGAGTAQIIVLKLANDYYNESLSQRILIEVLTVEKVDQDEIIVELLYEKLLGDEDFYIDVLGGSGTGDWIFAIVFGEDYISLSPEGKVSILGVESGEGIAIAEVSVKKLGDIDYNDSNELTIFIIIFEF